MRRVEIRLLGGFRVELDGVAVPDSAWRHRRGADLVKVLALAPGLRLHREQLMDALWPEMAPDQAAANLRKATHFARRALGSDDAIGSTASTIALFPNEDVVLDVNEFERAAREAKDTASNARAAGLYGGELLPDDRYAAWSERARDRLRVQHLDVLRSAHLWEELLDEDRADEEAHRALMEEALARGDRHAVIRQFDRLRRALRADIGLGPGPASIAAYEKALAMEGRDPPAPIDHARAVLARALVAMNDGDLDDAERLAEDARSLAIGAEAGREVGEASALLGMVAMQRGRWTELFRSEFVASLRHPQELASAVFDAHICLADLSLYSPRGHEEIAPFARDLLALAEDAGSVHGRAVAMLLLGEVDLLSGRLDRANEHLSQSRDLHDSAGAESGSVLATERLAETSLAGGDRALATWLFRDALPRAEASPLSPHLTPRVQAGLIESAADEDAALAIVRSADRRLGRADLCPPCSMSYRIAAAKIHARSGDLDRANARLHEAERIAGMWQGGPWLAAVWEARGHLRRAEGNEAQATAMFAEAAGLFAESGRPLDRARCLAEAQARKDLPMVD